MGKSIIYNKDTSPVILASHAIQSVLSLWPEAKAEGEQMLEEYEQLYGKAVRALLVLPGVDRNRKGLPPLREIEDWWDEHDPFAETAVTIYRPWAGRWVLGSEPAELTVNICLTLDLLNPALGQSARKVWQQAGPLILKALASATDIPAETWRDAFDGRRQAKEALKERGRPFYGWQARALAKGAELWVLVRIPAPGADFGLTLRESCNVYHDRHPQEPVLDERHVSTTIAPWDEALGVTRTRGAPPGRPRSVTTH